MIPLQNSEHAVPALAILDTTLREGEQFVRAHFTSEQRLELARRLDNFGVDIIEVPSPLVSPQTAADVRALAALGLRARVVAHVRCVAADVDSALAAGVSGVNLYFGTSPQLRSYSHGHTLDHVAAEAVHQVQHVLNAGLYVRFSAEDAFRTPLDDLLPLFDAVVAAGVNRIGMPDTVGIATPRLVAERIGIMRERYPDVGIEFHGHNDTGCAVANALAALEAGADCIDATVLGIGERNGITSLSGLVAGVFPRWPTLLERYDLLHLPALDQYVAGILAMPIPFNSPITGEAAFTHCAGVHTNAVLRMPGAYEALDPAPFGLMRRIDITSRLVGYHAIVARAEELGITMGNDAARAVTAQVKYLADAGRLTTAQVDAIIRAHAGHPSPQPPSKAMDKRRAEAHGNIE